MKKITIALLALVLITGCSTQSKEEKSIIKMATDVLEQTEILVQEKTAETTISEDGDTKIVKFLSQEDEEVIVTFGAFQNENNEKSFRVESILIDGYELIQQ